MDFSEDNTSHVVTVRILFDANRKIRRAFTVHLSPDVTGTSVLGTRKVIVYIEQPSSNPAVTFPLPPMVVSLRDYDDVIGAESQIIMGYPVVCVTVRHNIKRCLNCEVLRPRNRQRLNGRLIGRNLHNQAIFFRGKKSSPTTLEQLKTNHCIGFL